MLGGPSPSVLMLAARSCRANAGRFDLLEYALLAVTEFARVPGPAHRQARATARWSGKTLNCRMRKRDHRGERPAMSAPNGRYADASSAILGRDNTVLWREVAVTAVLAATVAVGACGASGNQAAAKTPPSLAPNTEQICDSLVDWALALTDHSDAVTDKFFEVLTADDGTFTRDQEMAIRNEFFQKQEQKIRALSRTATDPQAAKALVTFADGWAALPLEPGGRTQPGRQPIDAMCPGLEARINAATASKAK